MFWGYKSDFLWRRILMTMEILKDKCRCVSVYAKTLLSAQMKPDEKDHKKKVHGPKIFFTFLKIKN